MPAIRAVGYYTIGEERKKEKRKIERIERRKFLLYISFLFFFFCFAYLFLVADELLILILLLLIGFSFLIIYFLFPRKVEEEIETGENEKREIRIFHYNIGPKEIKVKSAILKGNDEITTYRRVLDEIDPACPSLGYEDIIFVQVNPLLNLDYVKFLKAVSVRYSRKKCIIINPLWIGREENEQILRYLEENEENGWIDYYGVINIALEMEDVRRMESMLDIIVMMILRGVMMTVKDYIEGHTFVGFCCKEDPETILELVFDALHRTIFPLPIEKVNRILTIIASPSPDRIQVHISNIKSRISGVYQGVNEDDVNVLLLRNEHDNKHYVVVILSTGLNTGFVREGFMGRMIDR